MKISQRLNSDNKMLPPTDTKDPPLGPHLLSGPLTMLKPRRTTFVNAPQGTGECACENKSDGSAMRRSATTPLVRERLAPLADFATPEQMGARTSTSEEMDSADEAALQEAIVRSLQEKAFRLLVPLESHASQGGAIQALDVTCAIPDEADAVSPPREVSDDSRARQMFAYSKPNEAFREHLDSHGLQGIRNPGDGNNCAIYALVQQIKPDLKSDRLDREVQKLRNLYDEEYWSDKGKMLYLDTGVGGAAATLIRLVNEQFSVNIQVGVVEASIDDGFPVTSRKPISAPGANISCITHRLVIWDQQGHYEAVTAKADSQPSARD